MNIIIVENFAGFSTMTTRGEHLQYGLEKVGHRAKLVQLPWNDKTSHQVLQSMVAIRTVRISASDRVIALDFPSYYVDHWAKVVWLDDLGGLEFCERGMHPDPALHSAAQHGDRNTFRTALRVHVTRPELQERIESEYGCTATVLPVPDQTNQQIGNGELDMWQQVAVELCQ
jgi:hypothetical protein